MKYLYNIKDLSWVTKWKKDQICPKKEDRMENEKKISNKKDRRSKMKREKMKKTLQEKKGQMQKI